MKLPPYRAIVRADDKWSQRELFDKFIADPAYAASLGNPAGVPISTEMVPRPVNVRQFDVINFRRQVRNCVEAARLSAGRRPDGRRSGSYKYVQRHDHAKKRIRDATGAFLQTKVKEESGVASITN